MTLSARATPAEDWLLDSIKWLKARHGTRVPRIAAAHHSPPPPPGATRGGFCAIELDDGAVGISYALIGVEQAAAAPCFRPGSDALDALQALAASGPGARGLAFAALNALTRSAWDCIGYRPPLTEDSIAGVRAAPGTRVGMIGFFPPLVRALRERAVELVVVELRADLLREEPGLRVTLDGSALGDCEEVISTGTVLLNGSFARMRGLCPMASRFALIGPSVGSPPAPLFAAGVTSLGGAWVSDSGRFCAALRAGEKTSAHSRKFCIQIGDPLP